MRIIFATGNERKIGEAREACVPFGISVEKVELKLDEIQHHDPIEITKHKAREAYKQLNKAVVINDATWNIPVLNGFPGGYMNDVAQWFAPEDFISLMLQKKDRSICLVETVIYKDATTEKIFHKQFWGEIAKSPKGSGNSIEQVAIFNGRTIGQNRDLGKFAFESEDYIWHDFAKWFKRYSEHA